MAQGEAFASAGSDLLAAPSLSTLAVSAQPTIGASPTNPGQGVATGPDGFIAPSLLRGYPNNTTTFLRGDGAWTSVAQSITIMKPTRNNIASSTSETDLIGTAGSGHSIPGGTLGANGILRATIGGAFLNNTGANQSITMRAYLGATKLWDSGAATIATSATARKIWFEFLIQNQGATNSQRTVGNAGIGSVNAATTGFGVPFASGSIAPAASTNEGDDRFGSNGATSVDMTAAQGLRLTAQLSSVSGSLTVTTEAALLEAF